MIEGWKEARTKRKQSIKLGEFLCYKLFFWRCALRLERWQNEFATTQTKPRSVQQAKKYTGWWICSCGESASEGTKCFWLGFCTESTGAQAEMRIFRHTRRACLAFYPSQTRLTKTWAFVDHRNVYGGVRNVYCTQRLGLWENTSCLRCPIASLCPGSFSVRT